jgi:hypothetical protein
VQTGYCELDPPPWVTAYWVFILQYSWNLLNKSLFKNLLKFLKFSSPYYVIFYIKTLLKICLSKKFKFIYKSFYYLKALITMFSKSFWVFFIHYIDFKLLEYIYQYIENNIMWKKIPFKVFYFLKNVWYNQMLVIIAYVHINVTAP